MVEGKNIGGKIFGEILGAVIGLFLINNILGWHIPFITSNFLLYLPIANMAIVLTAVLKIVFYVLEWTRFKYLALVGAHVVSIWSLSYLERIFPFNFDTLGINFLNPLIHLALIIAIFALAIAIVVDIAKIFFQKD